MRIPRPRSPRFEPIAPGVTSSFAVMRYTTSYFPFVWHYHPEVELTLIVRGSGLRFVGESIEPYQAGDLVLIGSNVPHTWQSIEPRGRGAGQNVESIVIQFRAELFHEAQQSPPEFRRISALIDRARAGLRSTHTQTHAEVVAWMHDILRAPVGSVHRYTGLLRALDVLAGATDEILLSVSPPPRTTLAGGRDVRAKRDVTDKRNSTDRRNWTDRREATDSRNSTERRDATDKRLKIVLERVQQSLSEGDALTQAHASALLKMSQASFSRFFRRSVGRTFVRYVNEWRVGLACRALVHTDASITAIAFDCGFGNLSNFNRQFKTIKGTTPRGFRQADGAGST